MRRVSLSFWDILSRVTGCLRQLLDAPDPYSPKHLEGVFSAVRLQDPA
jgi:hypothetical protein